MELVTLPLSGEGGTDRLGDGPGATRMDERIRELRKVLTPVQQAKLALLLPSIEREFAQWVRQVAGQPGDPPER